MTNQVQDPITNDTRVMVRQTATGFEQGIAAAAGFFTAGPLGALASWGTLRGLQGKWAPWAILGFIGAPVCIGVQAVGLGVMAGAMDSLQTPQSREVVVAPTAAPPADVRTPEGLVPAPVAPLQEDEAWIADYFADAEALDVGRQCIFGQLPAWTVTGCTFTQQADGSYLITTNTGATTGVMLYDDGTVDFTQDGRTYPGEIAAELENNAVIIVDRDGYSFVF